MNGIDAAVGKVDASTRETPAFAHGVVLGILKAAEAEYAEAVKDGDITDAIEYQDSRGFVWVARDYAHQTAKSLKAQNAESYQEHGAQPAPLATAWPSPKRWHERRTGKEGFMT